ncbi:MAG: 3-deoxy-8-phosphooctulonate synthase [Bdellovibrionota bacterium]|nr:MAG: 3-deoxy-8-phosphooctulonate synthase [Bdellovibrionota bacterium]
MASRTVSITPQLGVGMGSPLLLIAGPCQIESLEHCLKIGSFVANLAARCGFSYVFKASFDKANRTSVTGQRGVGIERGLEILAKVRNDLGVPVLTDIHSPEQAAIAAQYVDVLQTPAFLCRQTDLLIAVGRTGKAVNVKKGQFLAPQDMQHVAAKIASTGNENILLCERGASFGYRDLVVDMRSLVLMQDTGYPVILDATHAVQSLGGESGQSGGDRRFVPALMRAAVAVGVQGLFFECHDDPDNAPSDGKTMLPLESLPGLLGDLKRMRGALA